MLNSHEPLQENEEEFIFNEEPNFGFEDQIIESQTECLKKITVAKETETKLTINPEID